MEAWWCEELVPSFLIGFIGPIRRLAGSSGRDWTCEGHPARVAEMNSAHSMWLVRYTKQCDQEVVLAK